MSSNEEEGKSKTSTSSYHPEQEWIWKVGGVFEQVEHSFRTPPVAYEMPGTYFTCPVQPNEDAQQSGENQTPTEASGAVFQGRCGRIASTMDEDMFILVTMKWQAFVEAAKETNDWFPATSSGVLLKEMVASLLL